MHSFILESLRTGYRQTVSANDWKAALDAAPGDNFLILKTPDGRFMAGTNQNSAFGLPVGHYADTPDGAAASIREHYATIRATQESRNPAITKH